VTVIHPVPTVAITADPSAIEPGGSSILQWTTTDADSVTIDQGIGEQPAIGQVTVTPSSTTTYTITAIGPGGTASSTVQIVVLDESLKITILEPGDQEVVPPGKLYVHGSLTTDATYANVSINGQRAVVENKEFFLNDLEIPPGNFAITVRASDSNRNLAEKTISVIGEASEASVDLTIDEPIGLVPFTTTLRAHVASGDILPGSATISYTGPGDVTGTKTSDSEFSLSFATPGLYTISYSSTDTAGTVLSAQLMVTAREPMSDEEWQAMTSSVEQLENLFRSQVGVTDIDTLRQQVLELARANGDFSSLTLSYDDLCLVYKGRIPFILDLSDPNTTKPKE
jgi:hypothetical protein